MTSQNILLNPVLKSALAGLDLDLEQELERYRSEALPDILPDRLFATSQDFDLDFNEDLDFNPTDLISEIDLEWDDPSSDLSNLNDDFSSDLSTELENTLDEEFLDLEFQDRLLAGEFAEISLSPDRDNQNFEPQYKKASAESTPNLLSPLGIIAMMLLLISSATVGYLLVDPSGLNRLLKKDAKPTSSLQQLELFQTNAANRLEQLPFTDFSTTKPQNKSSQDFSRILPLMLPPIGMGRTFEPPTRTELEQKIKNAIKVEPVAARIVKPSARNQNILPKTEANPNLKLDQTLPTVEVVTDPQPNSLPRSPLITLKEGVKQLKSPIMPQPVPPKPLLDSNPIMVLDATKPKPTAAPELKTEVIPEPAIAN